MMFLAVPNATMSPTTGLILFGLLFVPVIAVVVFPLIKGIVRWYRNNHAPCLTVPVTVARKNVRTIHRHHASQQRHISVTTMYTAAFRMENGEVVELQIPDAQYGIITEGGKGLLTFQGTRFLDYKREF